ncbi:helix-turn-helix transcriptional regulator [Pseudomonas sp. NY15181]|uniref:helix-turn-helix transcriptional regulator n=1 Tax=Pseudomonas sp. NY15181 TaxID=3400349 RepID=UPI003A844E6D
MGAEHSAVRAPGRADEGPGLLLRSLQVARAPAWDPTQALSELIGLAYEGLSEARPWFTLAERLRQLLGAFNVTITLYHHEDQPRDIQVTALDAYDRTDWDCVERESRERFGHIELLRPETVAPGTLIEFGPEDVEPDCAAYMAALGIGRCLRSCFAEPVGMRCWVDVVRGQRVSGQAFVEAERWLLLELMPHLARALGLYARLKREEAERAVYEDSLDHMALGCLLLDGNARVLCVNRTAQAIIARQVGLELRQGRLLAEDRSVQLALEGAFTKVMRARAGRGTACPGELVRLRTRDGMLLGILVEPVPPTPYYQGEQVPSLILHLCELSQCEAVVQAPRDHSPELIAQLFGLTRQEARLAAWLGAGQTISEAAVQMNIAVAAARNYSKNIYAKLGIKGQTDLVRLMCRSVALLR